MALIKGGAGDFFLQHFLLICTQEIGIKGETGGGVQVP